MNSRARRMVLMALESNEKSPSPIENIKSIEKYSVSNLPIQFDDGFILENCENNLEFEGMQVPEVMTAQSVDIFETNLCSEDTNEVELASSLRVENVETFEIEINDDPGKEVEDDTDEEYVMEDGKESSSSTSEEEAEENAPKEAEDDPVVNAEVEGSQNLKRKRSRKRFVNRSQWKRNNNKYKRMKGQAYIGYTRSKEKVWKNDTQREAKTMGKRCKGKHAKIYECSKLTDDVRSIIFSKFWSEMTWEQKKIFVVNHVDISKPTRRRTENQETQKSSTFKYFLKDATTKMRVCKSMFLSTLSLGEWSVRSWCQNSTCGTLPSVDVVNARRSSNREANGTILKNVEQRKFLETWLDNLPKLPSHYARRDTNKQYIEDSFIKSKSELYKRYTTDCTNIKALSSFTFDEIFDRKNLAIFQPKKDQCDVCCAYKAGNFETVTEEDYQCHIANKDRARIEKQTDKEASILGNCNMVTMDLQAVQLCPRLYASKLYFKMKLRVHNFTVYNVATHQSTNFWWHEGEGGVTSTHFASCIIDYLYTHFQNSDKPIILYSDGCGYQNRCTVVSNALLTFAVKERKTIEQKYLCKGHTQMECDTVHSLIERRLDRRDIHLPAEFISVTKRAREKPFPLDAKYLTHDFFKNYASPNFQWYNSLRPPGTSYVTDIKCLKYTPEGIIYYKTDFDSEYLPLRKGKTLPNVIPTYPQLYRTKPKISLEKYEHLMEISQVMEPDYVNFYKNLPHETSKKKGRQTDQD